MRRLAAASLLVAVLASACSRPPADPVEALLQAKRYLAAYESVAIDVYGVEAEREAESARVRCVVEFSGRARQAFGLEGLLPPSAVYRFDRDVADEDGTWRVRGPTWTPAEPEESGS
jgi:hypothetical protein